MWWRLPVAIIAGIIGLYVISLLIAAIAIGVTLLFYGTVFVIIVAVIITALK